MSVGAQPPAPLFCLLGSRTPWPAQPGTAAAALPLARGLAGPQAGQPGGAGACGGAAGPARRAACGGAGACMAWRAAFSPARGAG